MKEIGFLFPGQGAQNVGMGKDFYDHTREAKALFDRADKLLGFSLTKLCFEGTDEELTRTVNAQIAIFVTSLAVLSHLRSSFPQLKIALACGLSLGEFTALVALDSISFEEGLQLVRRRAELMEEAAKKNPGTMASLLGLSLNDCVHVCRETGAELANLNSHDQIVISGSVEVINKACELAKSKGAKRTILLKVGGAFHSSLMAHAKTGLEAALQKIEIYKPKGTFVPNVSGEPVSSPDEIRALLGKQLTQPVQWIKTMETVGRIGVKELLEVGPGRVLKGLARKANPELNVTCVEKLSDLEQLKPAPLNS